MVTETLVNIEHKMRTSVDILKKDLASIRTGHATPALIEHVKVEYSGATLPLNQLATTSAPTITSTSRSEVSLERKLSISLGDQLIDVIDKIFTVNLPVGFPGKSKDFALG